MSCLDENTAVEFVDKLLPSERTAAIEEHIASCGDCRRLVAALADASVGATIDAARSATLNLRPGVADTIASADVGETLASGAGEPSGLNAGSRIGRYEILKRLGEGGMGAVYLATDLELHRKVAIKVMHSKTPESAKRLLREARSMAKLRHPNVATVYDVGREGDDVYVAMEYIAGTTLRRWLESERGLRERLDVVAAAGAGLLAAHNEGLVHRDFKPDNVMVGDDGRVQVLDFGLAKRGGDEFTPSGDGQNAAVTLTQTGSLVGTPAYMAPEQFALGSTDARTDQFAFCIVLYEALHGARPFDGKSVAALAEAVSSAEINPPPTDSDAPEAVAEAIERGLSHDADDRFASMEPLLAILTRGEAPEPKRSRLPWAIGGVAVVALGAVLVPWTSLLGRGADGPSPRGLSDEVIASSNLPALRATPLADDPLAVTIHRLSNGLTVYISPNRQKPRIAARMVVRAGSRDDPATRSGVARLAERSMYAGSDRLGTTDFDKESDALARLRELHGQLDAAAPAKRGDLFEPLTAAHEAAAQFAVADEFRAVSRAIEVDGLTSRTDARSTVFSADMPTERFSQWASLEGERWSRPVARLFRNQLAALIAERRLAASNPAAAGNLDDLIGENVFPKHPYGRSSSGTFADLEREPLIAVEEFVASRYAPNNAALILAGDIDAETALPTLENAFARWRPRVLPPHPHPAPAPIKSRKLDVLSSAHRFVAVFATEADDWAPHEGAVTALATLVASPELFDAPASLGELSDVRFEVERIRGLPGWSLVATPAAKVPLADAEAALEARLAAIESGDYQASHVSSILNRARITATVRATRNNNRAERIANAYAADTPWPPPHALASRPVTAVDIAALAARVRRADKLVLRVELGEAALELPASRVRRTSAAAGKRSKYAAALLATETAERPLRFVWPGRDYRIDETPSGEVISVHNRDDDTFELRLVWPVGYEAFPVLCQVTRALEDVGVGATSSDELKRQFADSLLSVHTECDSERTALTLRGKDEHFDDNVDTVFAWFDGKALDRAALTAAAEAEIGERLELKGNDLAEAVIRFATSGPNAARLRAPSAKRLRQTSPGEATKTLAALWRIRRSTLYFGPRKDIVESANLRLDAATTGRAPAPPWPFVVTERPRLVLHDTGDGRDPFVAIVRLVRPLTESQVPALEVLDAIVTARLPQVSSSSSSVLPRIEDGALMAIAFSAPSADLATAIPAAIAAVGNPAITAVELDAAVAEAELGYTKASIPPRELTRTLIAWRDRGLEGDPRPARYSALKQLSVEAMRGFGARVETAPLTIAIVGDLGNLDRAALGRLGDVSEVNIDDVVER